MHRDCSLTQMHFNVRITGDILLRKEIIIIMKKKIAALILFGVMMLTMLSGCGKDNYADDSTESAEDQVSVADNEEESLSKEESLYDYVDYTGNDYSGYTGDKPLGCTGLGMKMDGYYRDESGALFYNDNVMISCKKLFERTDSNTPKSIDAFSIDIYIAFTPLLLLQDKNYNFEEEECTINGFSCKKYVGTVMTESVMTEPEETLSAKAYTFVLNGCDYIVIAAVREETDENIKMMENDIDVFMNNLGIIES